MTSAYLIIYKRALNLVATEFIMSTSSSIPGSPATSSSKIEPRPEEVIVDATNPKIMEDLRHQVFQGQLYKFTNVVKGE